MRTQNIFFRELHCQVGVVAKLVYLTHISICAYELTINMILCFFNFQKSNISRQTGMDIYFKKEFLQVTGRCVSFAEIQVHIVKGKK